MRFYGVFGMKSFSDCSVACFYPQRLSSIFVELIPLGVLLTPPQVNDAMCGFACHTTAKMRDYVFTEYGKR